MNVTATERKLDTYDDLDSDDCQKVNIICIKSDQLHSIRAELVVPNPKGLCPDGFVAVYGDV